VRIPEVDCIGAPPQPEGLEEVRRWRHEYASGLGFDEPEAALIAHRAEIDTHVLERLLRRGCAPYLALEIVR
jgi:xanthine/CO dehydrogenase XdhC/CoxF family maturation factor